MKHIFGFVLLVGWHLPLALAQSPHSEWNKIVEAGKKEGKVVVSVPSSAELRKEVERVFEQRFGIDAELIAGRAASIVGKIQQEFKSGVRNFDLTWAAGSRWSRAFCRKGMWGPSNRR